MRKKTFEESNCYQCYHLLCLYDFWCLKLVFWFKVPRKEWVLQWPGQTVICVSSIYWTEEVSEAIRTKTLQVRCSFNFLGTEHWLINKKLFLAKKILNQLGIPFQCLIILSVQKFFLIFNLNFPWHGLRLRPLVLSLVTWEPSPNLAPASFPGAVERYQITTDFSGYCLTLLVIQICYFIQKTFLTCS